jgi:NDP-sugar pyrophosphorylase family protein
MPMAGEGNRFKDAGYDVPKPLIKLNDKELYRHALDSFKQLENLSKDFNIQIKHTFIVRQEFIDNYNIDKEILKTYPLAHIIGVEKTTRGALETIMLAEKFINDDDCVISMDCDIEFDCPVFINNLLRCKPQILSFESDDPKYSYAKTNEDNIVIETAEKKCISTHAIAGCYCFGQGKKFKKYAKELIDEFTAGKVKYKEIYVSLIFNKLKGTKLISCDKFVNKIWSYGTPEDFENYDIDRCIWDR